MVVRQDIVTWYEPAEKLPPEGQIVVGTISGRKGSITYDHALTLLEWYTDGWVLTEGEEMDEFELHAWCDLDPYGGGS